MSPEIRLSLYFLAGCSHLLTLCVVIAYLTGSLT